LFDFITLLFRFMPLKELTNKLEKLVEIGVMQGRLEIIALIGLNSL